MSDPVLYVIEMKEDFDWIPTLEVAYVKSDLIKRMPKLKKGFKCKMRIRPYDRKVR